MSNIYIWGLSKYLYKVLESVDLAKANIISIIDSKADNTKIFQGYKVIPPEEMDISVDYVIVSTKVSYPEIKLQLCSMGYDSRRILCYYDVRDINWNEVNFINATQRISDLIEFQLEESLYKIRNIEYEIADKIRCDQYKFPIIESSEKCLNKIIAEKVSLCRFGDGEFEMIAECSRPEFQQPDKELAMHLRRVLQEENYNCLVAIADNYGALDKYTEAAQRDIRSYLAPEIRTAHMSLIDVGRVYYDTYVSRPYIIYKDKAHACKVFQLWKKVWKERDIVIVEGEFSRNGYRNDLFNSANSIERILCAQRDVWNQYSEIYNFIVKNIDKDKLILISLGPTATVLAYELSKQGYQAIDIGQVDNEYEWFLANAESRINVDHKYVSEFGLSGRCVTEDADESFYSQVIKKICKKHDDEK